MLSAPEMYRHYLAMTLAVDEMLGGLLDYLDRTGRADDTLVVFGSDHGTQVGAHDLGCWDKKLPYEESLCVPLIARWPGVIEAGARRETLTAPVDIFPTLCGLAGLPVPRSVEGHDLSAAWRGEPGAFEQDAVLTMNFTASHDYLQDGQEWRGVRTRDRAYTRWLDGRAELYDLQRRPPPDAQPGRRPGLRRDARGDGGAPALPDGPPQRRLVPCHTYADWFDAQRRVVRNAYGPLSDPEDAPDWSLLDQPSDGG